MLIGLVRSFPVEFPLSAVVFRRGVFATQGL